MNRLNLLSKVKKDDDKASASRINCFSEPRLLCLLLICISAVAFLSACDSIGFKDDFAGDGSTIEGENTRDMSSEIDAKSNEETQVDSRDKTSEKKVLSIMHRFPLEEEEFLMGNLLKHIFDQFEEENPDIELLVNSVPSSMYEEQLNVRLASEDGPDVYIFWPGGRTESMIRKGDILDVSDMWHDLDLFDIFKPGVIAGSMHTDGEFYNIPIESKPNTFWYNKAIYDELNLSAPKTWDDLLNNCAIIKEAGYTPFALGGKLTRWMPAFWFDYLLLNTAGGKFREDLMWGRESWESEEVYRVFEIWKELIDLGYFNENFDQIDSKEAILMVGQGQAAMMLQGPWALTGMEMMNLEPIKDFDMFPFPLIDESVDQVSEGAIVSWAINAKSDKIDLAKRLLSFMTKYDTVKYLSINRRTLGARKDIGMDIYSEDTRIIMEGLNDVINTMPLYMNFELATLPPIQDGGMDAIIAFMKDPDSYKEICAGMEALSRETFDK